MKTAVLKISANPGGGYLKRLYIEAAGSDWKNQPAAEDLLEDDLKVDPVEQVDGAPLSRGRLRELFLSNPESKLIHEQLGAFLHNALFSGKAGEQWEELRSGVTGGANKLRLFLDLEPIELKALPWELLFSKKDRSRLFIDTRYIVARGRLEAVGEQVPKEDHEHPLRALVVVACDPEDTEIRSKEEWVALEQAFRKLRHMVDLHVLRQPTRAELVEAYEDHQPHLFHFLGHGTREAGSDQPCLVLWTSAGKEHWLVDEIVNDLRSWNGMHVAFVNACFSSTETAAEDSWSLTQALHEVGARAVIGMQAEVPGDKAAAFSGKFYSQLAQDVPLEQALVEARKSLTLGVQGLQRNEWALPTVSFVGATKGLLPRSGSPPPPANEFERLPRLVDRQNERQQLARSEREKDRPSLVILEGEKEVGKTTLLHWLLERWAQKGKRILHVDLKLDPRRGSLTEFDFLRRVRKGDVSSHGACLICRPLPAEHFKDFDAVDRILTGLAAGRDAPAPVAPQGTDTGGGILSLQGTLEENPFSHVFDAFARGLGAAAGDSEVILALDHISGVLPDAFVRHIRPKLLEAAASGGLRSVRVVVCANKKEIDTHGLRSLQARTGVLMLQVSKFPKKQLKELIEEYYRARLTNAEHLEKFLRSAEGFHKVIDNLIDAEWGPEVFEELVEPYVKRAER